MYSRNFKRSKIFTLKTLASLHSVHSDFSQFNSSSTVQPNVFSVTRLPHKKFQNFGGEIFLSLDALLPTDRKEIFTDMSTISKLSRNNFLFQLYHSRMIDTGA